MRAIRKMQRVILALFILTLLAFCGLRIYRRLTVDVTPPVITCSTDSIDVSVTAGEEALLQGVMASDDRDGDLTDQILIKGVSPSLTDSSAQVTYIVFDSANNMATVTRTVRYTDYEAPRFALSQPLVYPAGQTVTLLDRLTASDVLDGDISSGIRITSQNVINSQPGVYSVTAQVDSRLGSTVVLPLKVVITTGGPQLITLSDYLVYLPRGSAFDAAGYIQSVTAPTERPCPPDRSASSPRWTRPSPERIMWVTASPPRARAIPSIWRWWWNKGGIVMDENNQGLQWSHIEPLCILRALARQLWMLLLAALTCAMAAWIVLTCFVTQQYTSSTTFSVTTRTSNLYYTNITAAADVAASYSQLLQSRVLRQTMEQDLGMPLNGAVSAQQLGETNLIRVTVTAGTPRQALVLLKAVSDNYGSLSAHVSSTAVLSQLNSPSLSVAPSRSYNVPRICLMAAIAGAALTALGVAWASVSSGTVQTQEGARSDLDAKIISTVPHEGRRTRKLLGWFDDRRRERRARRGGKRLRRNLNISSPAISFAFTESIHRIAEKFQHEHANGRRVFLFSSVSAAEGKSTLAANTAISLASRGVNVLFIDLDLRRPVQSEMLGLSVKQKNELGTLLTESAAPEKILSAAVTDPATGLHSLLSTKSYTDVIELLASDQLAKVVALARERYDYVIIDSPPLGFFSDSELLSDLSDASVLVVRQDTVPAPEINDAIDALRAGKAEFLGCILNDMAHLAAWSSGYGYGYGKKYDKYGYGQHSARKTQ